MAEMLGVQISTREEIELGISDPLVPSTGLYHRMCTLLGEAWARGRGGRRLTFPLSSYRLRLRK